MDLPSDDDSAGLSEYADAVVAAVGAVGAAAGDELVVVAQSLGGFTAPLVCDRLPVRLIILVAAMVPAPGESPGEWWANTGWTESRTEQAALYGSPADGNFDEMATFFHDVPPEITTETFARGARAQSGTPFEKPWPLDAWPDVPTRFLLCRDDRFFPADFQRRVVRERLGIVADEMDGGHLPALAHPHELVRRLEAYRTELFGR